MIQTVEEFHIVWEHEEYRKEEYLMYINSPEVIREITRIYEQDEEFRSYVIPSIIINVRRSKGAQEYLSTCIGIREYFSEKYGVARQHPLLIDEFVKEDFIDPSSSLYSFPKHILSLLFPSKAEESYTSQPSLRQLRALSALSSQFPLRIGP